MTRKLLNPARLYDSIPTALQREIGILAITYELSSQGATIDLPAGNRDPAIMQQVNAHEATADMACGLLQDLIVEVLPNAFDDDGVPHRIDLNPLGIRQCITCGCTEYAPCDGGCGWAGPTTCTSCARGRQDEGPPDAAA